MKSIWNNTFYNTQPALAWTFELSFDEYYEGDNNENAAGLNRFAQAAVDISVGKRESEYASVFYGGVEFKKLTRAQNTGTFTIKFNEDKFYTITGILENIYNNDNLNQNYFDAGTHVYNWPTIGTRKIVVKMYDPNTMHVDPNPVVSYEFYNCHIMSIDDASLSYESSDTITRSVTFVYDYMKYRDFRAEAAKEQRQKEAEEKAKKSAEKKAELAANRKDRVKEMGVLGMVAANEQNWNNATALADEEVDRDIQNQKAYTNMQASRGGYRGGHR